MPNRIIFHTVLYIASSNSKYKTNGQKPRVPRGVCFTMGALFSIHWDPTPSVDAFASCRVATFACDAHFVEHVAMAFCAFLLLGTLFWWLVNNSIFRTQSMKTRITLVSSLVQIVHHSIVTPFAAWALYVHATTRLPPYPAISLSLALYTGYIVADVFIIVVPLRHLTYSIHHFVSLLLIAATASKPMLLRWIPCCLLLEASSLGHETLYVLNKSGYATSIAATAIAICQKFLFCTLRILYAGTVCIAILSGTALEPDREAFGLVGQGAVAAMWLIQVYFLSVIFYNACNPKLKHVEMETRSTDSVAATDSTLPVKGE